MVNPASIIQGGNGLRIAAIILAAGQSQRFGGDDKRLAVIDGEPLLRRVVLRVAKSVVGDVFVVMGPDDDETSDAVRALSGLSIIRITNRKARDGMGSSIAAGVTAVGPEIDGVLVVPADMPDVSPELIDKLIKKFEAGAGEGVVVPTDDSGRQRNPVLWSRSLFPTLMKLDGPAGGKAIIRAHGALVQTVTWADERAFHDIDTREELSGYIQDSETRLSDVKDTD